MKLSPEAIEAAARAMSDADHRAVKRGEWAESREQQALTALEAALRDDATQRLARAAFAVDSKHHFWDGELGPTCLCGFIGNARKRTQTEHITLAVMEAFDHD